MNPRQQKLWYSPRRLWTISRNTMTEIIRQKFFYILVIFGMVVLVSSLYFSQFSMQEIDRTKFIKDFCLAAIKIFGTLIAIVGTAQLLPLELENRTIYPILAKPVYRVEFLLGKYVGMISLLFITILAMSAIFGGVLFYTEYQLLEEVKTSPTGQVQQETTQEKEAAQEILKQTRDPALVKAIALIYCQTAMICSISLLIGTFATSVVFNVIATVMIYLTGHLEGLARAALVGGDTLMNTGQAIYSKIILLIITFLVPDLGAFDVVDSVITGQLIPMSYVLKTMGYGIFYSTMALLVAYLIFEEKEI